MFWQPHHDSALQAHVEKGELSYAAIANEMSVQFGTRIVRKACIGRAFRKGWKIFNAQPNQNRVGVMKPPKPRAEPKVRIRKPLPPKPEVITMQCEEIVPRNLTLLELEPEDCRFPIGHSAPYHFCGHPVIEGASYCLTHLALSRRGAF